MKANEIIKARRMVNTLRHAESIPSRTRQCSFGILAESRHGVPKSIPKQLSIPNKKAPQNAKYSVLRGYVLPAAGVEPAQNIDVGRCWKMLCQNACQKVEVALP